MKPINALAAGLLLAATLASGARAGTELEPQKVEVAGALDAEWASYRHAYEANSFFGKFVKKRSMIQAQMQLRPLNAATPMTGLVVRLVGAKTDLQLAANDIGLVTVPQLKQAYDEDAVLRLNRAKGLYQFSGRYSILLREDGVYGVGDLDEACEQLIGAQRESGYRIRLWGKKCVGVKFIYPADASAASVDLHAADDRVTPIAAVDGQPFEDNSMGLYKIVVVRFKDWPKDGRVVTAAKPLAIGTLYE
jgi:hypothetical protein